MKFDLDEQYFAYFGSDWFQFWCIEPRNRKRADVGIGPYGVYDKLHFVCFPSVLLIIKPKGGRPMKKEEEKKPTNWEIADPKPPIVQSGHLENRKQH